MFSDMPSDGAGVGIVAAARRGPDNNPNGFAVVKRILRGSLAHG
jgi:hypothetical protein